MRRRVTHVSISIDDGILFVRVRRASPRRRLPGAAGPAHRGRRRRRSARLTPARRLHRPQDGLVQAQPQAAVAHGARQRGRQSLPERQGTLVAKQPTQRVAHAAGRRRPGPRRIEHLQTNFQHIQGVRARGRARHARAADQHGEAHLAPDVAPRDRGQARGSRGGPRTRLGVITAPHRVNPKVVTIDNCPFRKIPQITFRRDFRRHALTTQLHPSPRRSRV